MRDNCLSRHGPQKRDLSRTQSLTGSYSGKSAARTDGTYIVAGLYDPATFAPWRSEHQLRRVFVLARGDSNKGLKSSHSRFPVGRVLEEISLRIRLAMDVVAIRLRRERSITLDSISRPVRIAQAMGTYCLRRIGRYWGMMRLDIPIVVHNGRVILERCRRRRMHTFAAA